MNPSVALPPPVVLTFAATDPTGGTGIQADCASVAAIGCHALSVVTSLTVQDSVGVFGVLPVDAEWVEDQARAVLEDMPVDAFKVGLVGCVENIVAIANVLSDYPDVPVVFDPLLISGRGDELVDEEMLAALRALLLPQVTVLTVNAHEARRLAAPDEEDEGALETAAGRLVELGCEYVLLSGTQAHSAQVINDLYSAAGRIQREAWPRLPGSYHGAGCTLSAAVAACLAHGLAVPDAVREAQEFTWRALAAAFRPGMGRSLPDRFFWARRSATSAAAPNVQED